MVMDEQKKPIEQATVQLLLASNNAVVKAGVTNKQGFASFKRPKTNNYFFKISAVGFISQQTTISKTPVTIVRIVLLSANKDLGNVDVIGKKQYVQRSQGKTIINVDASITNAGATVLEVLEKSPGVMVDKNGGISLQGKAGVLVMIDDKQTYLSGTELNNLLSNMSASQVNQIELIANPSAKYDASGNAGIINIKTKKNRQEGFNGSVNIGFGHGRHYKNNNGLLLNFKKGKFNTFANFAVNSAKNFTDIYAYRQYFNSDGNVASTLDQTSNFNNKNQGYIFKTGVDFYASEKTTVGLTLSGLIAKQDATSEAIANWKSGPTVIDSAIGTYSTTDFNLKNGGINVNLKHAISKKQGISIDLDALKYSIKNDQSFRNRLLGSDIDLGGTEAEIPSDLKILSGKIDHQVSFGKYAKIESGFKSSSISTDNTAAYQLFNGTTFAPDLNKSNHFLYRENINALYTSFETKFGKFSAQAGLRYENTYYNAHQLGNEIRPDSAFSRNYSNLFPSGYVTYQADSLNSFTLTASRRIDRPAYQKLNPFVFIINKYTYQTGNPYFLPQYTWNLELSHQFKQLLTTSVSYSVVKDYFSQLFLSQGTDILVYTEGNVGRMHNLGASVALQVTPFKWWNINAQSTFNYKKLNGYRDSNYSSSINQLLSSVNNQFTITKTLSAEISGNYITRARNDLQELLYPKGQVSVGLSKSIFKGKGSLKLNARDIFYTQVMEGLTDFPGATEYFRLKRDTRVVGLNFTYRFGKPLKATKRSSGGAAEEINRAGK